MQKCENYEVEAAAPIDGQRMGETDAELYVAGNAAVEALNHFEGVTVVAAKYCLGGQDDRQDIN